MKARVNHQGNFGREDFRFFGFLREKAVQIVCTFRLNRDMVESIIGIRGKDFILLAQDTNTTKYGILNMKFDTNRLFKLSEHCAMLAGRSTGRSTVKQRSPLSSSR